MEPLDINSVPALLPDSAARKALFDLLDCLEENEVELLNNIIKLAFSTGYGRGMQDGGANAQGGEEAAASAVGLAAAMLPDIDDDLLANLPSAGGAVPTARQAGTARRSVLGGRGRTAEGAEVYLEQGSSGSGPEDVYLQGSEGLGSDEELYFKDAPQVAGGPTELLVKPRAVRQQGSEELYLKPGARRAGGPEEILFKAGAQQPLVDEEVFFKPSQQRQVVDEELLFKTAARSQQQEEILFRQAAPQRPQAQELVFRQRQTVQQPKAPPPPDPALASSKYKPYVSSAGRRPAQPVAREQLVFQSRAKVNAAPEELVFKQPARTAQPAATGYQGQADQQNIRGYVQGVIDRIKTGKITLPVFPHVARKVLDILDNPDLTVQEMSREIKYDPVLATKIVGIANSAYYGGKSQNQSLETSIVKIGLLEVRKHLYTIATQNIYEFRAPVFTALLDRLSAHATASANAAYTTAKILGLANQDQYLLITLLHDIGKLWLVQIFSELYEQKAKSADDQETVLVSIAKLFQMLHSQMGAKLLTQWNFDQRFADIVAAHHKGIDPTNRDLCVVQFGNYMAKSIGYGVAPDEPFENEVAELSAALNIPSPTVQKIQAELLEFMRIY